MVTVGVLRLPARQAAEIPAAAGPLVAGDPPAAHGVPADSRPQDLHTHHEQENAA